MSTETRLQELLAVGAVFKGYVSPSDAIPLAAAHIAESGELWICPLWPKSNPATKRYAFSNIEDRGRYFAFKNAENQPVCSIAPLIQIKERRLSGISGLDKMRPQKRDGISQGPRKPR